MDTAQWPEGIGLVKKSSMDQEKKAAVLGGSGSGSSSSSASSRAQAALIKPQALNCPRCHSTHTKFCYYNNYSLSQPRYFCKTCRRYWTEGGSLRNVPVGGGSRKNKRSSSSSSPSSNNISSSSSSSSKNINNKLLLPPTTNHHLHHMGVQVQVPVQVPQGFTVNPSVVDHDHQDLNLKYPPNSVSEFLGLPSNNNNSPSSSQFSAMELLKNGINGGGGSMMIGNPFLQNIPVSNHDQTNPMIFSSTVLQSGNGNGNVGSVLPFQEFINKSGSVGGLNFTLDGFESRYNGGGGGGVVHESTSASARLFFPFEDLRPVSASTDEHDQQDGGQQQQQAGDHHSSGGYWNNGGLGGGSW